MERGIILSIMPIKAGREVESAMVDYSDCTLIPGVIDSHAHLIMAGTGDPKVREAQLNAPCAVMREVIRGHLSAQISHGVVAVRDGGDYGG
jgi:imidazolonepropionase-like amidohydrolase